MRAVLSLLLQFTSLMLLFLGSAQAQLLTPGAAAIGGTTTDAPLIAPGGQPTQSGIGPFTQIGAAVDSPTIHLPDPAWELTLPPRRGNRGSSTTGSSTTTSAASVAQSAAEPAPSPEVTNTSPSAPAAVPEAATTGAATPENTTTTVTAGAAQVAPPPIVDPEVTDPEISVTNTAPPAIAPVFERAALNFGDGGVDLTAEHEIALGPVVGQMRANPLEPLRVAAVLALAEASNEDAKLLARRRILAVRRYLIEQGVNAENLSFVISANSATEPFANHVLIERIDG